MRKIYLHKKFDSFPKSVNAASTSSAPVAAVKNKASFTKEGYIMRILNDKDASKIYVGKSNYKKLVKNITPSKKAKTISPKKVQKVKFRIEKVLNVKGSGAGAPVYLVASKDKKYLVGLLNLVCNTIT